MPLGFGTTYSILGIPKMFLGFPGGLSDKEPAANAGDVREAHTIPGAGMATLSKCPCLENPMDRGAWGYSPQGH